MSDEPIDNDTHHHDTSSLDSVVARAVDLGYSVAQDQIDMGQRIAEQVSGGKIDATAVKGNMKEIVERLQHFYSDLGALWFEMLESVFRNPAMGEWFEHLTTDPESRINGFAANGAGPEPQAAPPKTNGHAYMPVEIVSEQATNAKAMVKMHAHPAIGELIASPLFSRDTAKSPLTNIEFIEAQDDWPTTVRITIPAGHPPGTYSGLILNSVSDEPAGTLCVQIPAPPEHN